MTPPAAPVAPLLKPIYQTAQYVSLARRIMQMPTAPYGEHFVAGEIARFVQERPALDLSVDAHGNLLIRYEGRHKAADRAAGHWVLTAHLDHPGFAVRRGLSGGRVEMEFLGGVAQEYFRGAPIALFNLDRPPRQRPLKATVLEARMAKDERGRRRVKTVIARLRRPLPVGTRLDDRWIGMWDLPICERRGDMLRGRVMDDLAAVVCALAVLDCCQHRRPSVRVDLLLTRAEEVGLCGMIAAARSRTLPKSASYLNLECSNYHGRAEMGAGPIVRVGDLMTAFDPGVTGALMEIARPSVNAGTLALQRKLMDGGTCEATVLCNQGYRAGAVCLGLKNYHNMGARNKIEPECISIHDALGLIHLCWLLIHSTGGAAGAVRTQKLRVAHILDLNARASDARLRNSRFLLR